MVTLGMQNLSSSLQESTMTGTGLAYVPTKGTGTICQTQSLLPNKYVLLLKKALLGDTVVMRKLIECFMSQQSSAYHDMTKRSRRTAIAQVAAHRLIAAL